MAAADPGSHAGRILTTREHQQEKRGTAQRAAPLLQLSRNSASSRLPEEVARWQTCIVDHIRGIQLAVTLASLVLNPP
jgi:hypothetical protein